MAKGPPPTPTDPNESSAQLFSPGRIFGRIKLALPSAPPAQAPTAAAPPAALATPPVTTTAPSSALTAAAASPLPPVQSAPSDATNGHPYSKWVIWSDTTQPLTLALPEASCINTLYVPDWGSFAPGSPGVFGVWVGALANGDPFFVNAKNRIADVIRVASNVRLVTFAATFTGFSVGPVRIWVSEEHLGPFCSN